MSKLFLVFILTFCLYCFPRSALSEEVYFLDNSQVLLYKIINWWYYAPDEEGRQICGDEIKCISTENAKVSFTENNLRLTIFIKAEFAELLTLSDECVDCSGSHSFEPIYLNNEYFHNAEVLLNINESAFTNHYAIEIKNISKKEYLKIKELEEHLVLTLNGTVQGLQDGKVALKFKGDHLNKCTMQSGVKIITEPILNFVVTNSTDGSTLLKFDLSTSGTE